MASTVWRRGSGSGWTGYSLAPSGQFKQALDQGFQVGLPGVDSLQIALAGSFIGGYALQQGLGISADGGQRAFDVPLA